MDEATEPVVIHVQWEGPFSLAETAQRNDRKLDYGVYHVCGTHPVYGSNALLYIGRAQKQTFAVRLQQELWPQWQTANGAATFYLGRLHGGLTPENEIWDTQIAHVEKLLILAHRPAHNAKDLHRWNEPRIKKLHVLNWGERGKIMPEVSGLRWSSHFNSIPGYGPYGSHTAQNGEEQEPDKPIL